MDATYGNRERRNLQQLSARWSPLSVGANHRLLERRMPEEATARGHALDMLTSGRCPERDRGESEATRQHTGSQDPDGGLARHPLEASPAPCLPPPQAHVPSHATWRCQNRTPAPKPAAQVLVGTAVRGASGEPRQPWETHRGHRWGAIAPTASTRVARARAPSHWQSHPAATHMASQTGQPGEASARDAHPT
jgi:hypothetical protein